MDYSNVIVMLARQRSGTNALRDILDAHSDIFCLPEVFQSEPSPKARFEVETNYFNFLERHEEGIKAILTSEDSQERFFLEYLEFLRSFSDKRYLLIDIKYNSAHNVDGPWREITAEPSLFEFIRRHDMRVLNLTRANYLRFYLSWTKTNLTRRYHLHASQGNQARQEPAPDGTARTAQAPASDGQATIQDETMTVDLDDLLFRLDLCQSEDRVIARMLGDYPHYTTIEYEDLFPRIGGPPSQEVLGRLAAWLKIEADFPKAEPRYRKQSVLPLSEAIANYDDVARALCETDFEYCLEDERAYRNPPTFV
jgi:hypothetical protein